MTWVERRTRCIREDRPRRSLCVAHCVVMHRTEDDLREMVWHVMPSAKQCFNDVFNLYDTICYPGAHQSLPKKRATYRQAKRSFRRVAGDNAERRHYLARLARKSRCFWRGWRGAVVVSSGVIEALSRSVDLFVLGWNRRQRFHRQLPKLQQNPRDFITAI